MKKMSWMCGLVLFLFWGFDPLLAGSGGSLRITEDGIVFGDGSKQTTAATGTGPGASVLKTGQTTSYRPGDDGDLQKGVSWPSPRFTDNGNGTVMDNLTGLMWVKAPHHLSGNADAMTWNDAIDFCNGLNHAGYSDWTLPNRFQLESLLDLSTFSPALPSGNPFSGVKLSYYWSSTTGAINTSFAWLVNFYQGFVYNCSKDGTYDVWPVRGGR